MSQYRLSGTGARNNRRQPGSWQMCMLLGRRRNSVSPVPLATSIVPVTRAIRCTADWKIIRISDGVGPGFFDSAPVGFAPFRPERFLGAAVPAPAAAAALAPLPVDFSGSILTLSVPALDPQRGLVVYCDLYCDLAPLGN